MVIKVLEKKGNVRLLHYSKCKYHDGFYSVESSGKDVGKILKITNDQEKAKAFFDKTTTKSTKERTNVKNTKRR